MKKSTKVFLILFLLIVLSLLCFYLYLKSLRGFIPKDYFNEEEIVYIDETGHPLYGYHTIDGYDYYFDEETGVRYSGFKENEEGTFYFDEEGKKVKGLCTIDENTYYFDEQGKMLKDGYYEIEIDDEKQFSYFHEDGRMAFGLTNIDEKKVMFSEKGELQIDFEQLKVGIENILRKYGGKVEVYFKDLMTDTSFTIHENQKMYPCSIVKAFALVKVFDSIEKNEINYKQYEKYIERMITISDNTSYNRLLKAVGKGNGLKGLQLANELFEELGFHDTQLNHGLTPGEDFFTNGGSNKTTPKDFGLLLEKLYKGEIISKERSNQMIDILKKCLDSDYLQAGLPEGVEIAHKTGWAYDYYHDGGLIFTDNGDYILVVFADKVNHKKLISEISAYVYNFQMNSH